MKRLLACLCCLVLMGVSLSAAAEEPEVVKLKIVTPPEKTRYIEGETFDPAGIVVNAVLADESVVENVPCTFEVGEVTPNGFCPVNCVYGGKSAMQVVFFTLRGNTEPYAVASTERLAESPLAGKTYVFLGSSVTYGASSEKESMVDFLAARHGAVCVKEAVSGTTLASPKGEGKSYVRRFERLLASEDCPQAVDAFICQLSTNDLRNPDRFGEITADDVRDKDAFNVATTFGAMEYIVALARERWNCPVVFYTNCWMDKPDYLTMIEGLDRLAEKWGVTEIDLFRDEAFNNLTPEQYALYMADEIHPTRAGYRDWWLPRFEAALTALAQNGAQP